MQTNITGVCRKCSQSMDHTRFAPAHSSVCFLGLYFSGSRVLCRAPAFRALPTAFSCATENLSHSGSRVLRKGTDLVGHVFCALPRSEQFRQPGAW